MVLRNQNVRQTRSRTSRFDDCRKDVGLLQFLFVIILAEPTKQFGGLLERLRSFDSPSPAFVQSAFFQTVPGRRRSFTGRDIVRCRFCARAGTSALPIAFGVGGSDGYF